MNNYLVVDEEEEKTAYKIVNELEFFESINWWFIEDKTETTLKVLVDSDDQMVLVDTAYLTEDPIVLGVTALGSGAAVLFSSEAEIMETIEKNVDFPEKVILNFPSTVH